MPSVEPQTRLSAYLARTVLGAGNRFAMWTFRLALRLNREATYRAIDGHSERLYDDVAESLVHLGKAREIVNARKRLEASDDAT